MMYVGSCPSSVRDMCKRCMTETHVCCCLYRDGGGGAPSAINTRCHRSPNFFVHERIRQPGRHKNELGNEIAVSETADLTTQRSAQQQCLNRLTTCSAKLLEYKALHVSLCMDKILKTAKEGHAAIRGGGPHPPQSGRAPPAQ